MCLVVGTKLSVSYVVSYWVLFRGEAIWVHRYIII